jgi:hypothetical protein
MTKEEFLIWVAARSEDKDDPVKIAVSETPDGDLKIDFKIDAERLSPEELDEALALIQREHRRAKGRRPH